MKGHPANCIHSSPINFGGRFLDGTTPLSQEGQEVSNFFGQSSFGSYAIAKEGNVVKVDKDVDIALLGPLGCGIQTGSGTVLNRLRPEFGSSLVVYGAGAVGLSAVMAAKLVGCLNIIVVDIHDNRLELAKELGARGLGDVYKRQYYRCAVCCQICLASLNANGDACGCRVYT